MGRLVRRPGGPPRQMLKSNDLPPLTGEGQGGRGEVSEGQLQKSGGEGRRDWNREGAQGPLALEGRLYLDICVRVPEFPVTPLLMGLKSQHSVNYWFLCVCGTERLTLHHIIGNQMVLGVFVFVAQLLKSLFE